MPGPAATAAAAGLDRWAQWDVFVEDCPATGFMQSSWWADFRVDAGYEHFAAILRQQSIIIGGAVVMKFYWDDESCFYYIPEGPVLPADQSLARRVFSAMLAGIDDARSGGSETVSHLRIEPRWTSLPDFARGFREIPAFMDAYMEPRDTLCVDLRHSEQQILAQMKPKGRYNIRVARRHGVTVTEDVSDRALDDFVAIYEDMGERQGLNCKPREYFESLLSLLSSRRKGSMFFAEYGGTRLAAALVVYFGGRATYFFGASLDRHRHVMAPYLLHFEIMRRARALGCECYDLWGVAPAGTIDHPWRNISAFKHKFGGRELSLVPTLDYVYDPAAYERYLAQEADPAMISRMRSVRSATVAAAETRLSPA